MRAAARPARCASPATYRLHARRAVPAGTQTPMPARFFSVARELGARHLARRPGARAEVLRERVQLKASRATTPRCSSSATHEVPDFIRSQKRLPRTHLRAADMQWDFRALSPESAHQVTSRGAAASRGRGGDRAWRVPDVDGQGADHALRQREDQPAQPVRRDRAGRVRTLQPRARRGRQSRQDAAGPSSPTPTRIGTDYDELPVNRPVVPAASYAGEGAMRHYFTGRDYPVYAPDSMNGPEADAAAAGGGGRRPDGKLIRSAGLAPRCGSGFSGTGPRSTRSRPRKSGNGLPPCPQTSCRLVPRARGEVKEHSRLASAANVRQDVARVMRPDRRRAASPSTSPGKQDPG